MANTLKNRGHVISYLSIGVAECFLKSYGFTCLRILQKIFPETVHNWPDTKALQIRLQEYLSAGGYTLADVLAPELQSTPFDIIVCDSVLIAGHELALRSAMRLKIVALQVTLPEGPIRVPPALPTVILCPSELQLPYERTDLQSDSLLFAEPSIFHDRLKANAGIRVAASPGLVYCSFGSQSARYRYRTAILENIIQAFSGRRVNVLIDDRREHPTLTAKALPPNISIVQHADQLEVLKQASLFITHGGLGSIKESIMIGVPTLVIPFDMDQPKNAARVQYHRLGRSCLPQTCTPEKLLSLSDSIAEGASTRPSILAMKRVFSEHERKAPAADFIVRWG